MNEYFWLLCGLWCGIGGSIFAWFKLKKGVNSGEFSQAEVLSFVRGMAFWFFVPCLALWILQSSISCATQPNYQSWPSPQKYIALVLQIFIWIALIGWVSLRVEQILFLGLARDFSMALKLFAHQLHLNFMPSSWFYQALMRRLVQIPNPTVKQNDLRPAAYLVR